MMRVARISTATALLTAALFLLGAVGAAQTVEPVPPFTEWTMVDGVWEVWDDTLLQMEPVGGNTSAYVALDQRGEIHIYEWTVQFLDTVPGSHGPLAGLHILSDDATLGAQRGNSYLIWPSGIDLKVYKSSNGTDLATLATAPYRAALGETYVYRTVVDTLQGTITVLIDGEEALTLTDPSILTAGAYISVRTNVTAAIYSDIKYGSQ